MTETKEQYTPEFLKKWEMPRDYFGASFPDYFVFVGTHRDADSLTRSNFEVARQRLDAIPEPENWTDDEAPVICPNFNHWAVGWIQSIFIHQDATEHLKAADEMQRALDNYPVLDEEHWSDLQTNEAESYWQSLSTEERISLCQDYDVSIFAARHEWIPSDDSGAIFDALAS